MPVGAYGGRRDVMSGISPLGPVYQAGTLSGNPVAMAAGLAQLTILKETSDFYRGLNEKSDKFFARLDDILKSSTIPFRLNHVGSLGCVFFTGVDVTDYASAQTADTDMFKKYFRHMLDRGIYIAPSQFEAMFISAAHTDADLDAAAAAAGEFAV